MNLFIAAANGQIARIVENRVLNEPAFQDVNLTLFLRNADRLNASRTTRGSRWLKAAWMMLLV